MERWKKFLNVCETILCKAFLGAIGAWRAALSPLLPPSCRFVPSCSAYARLAIRQYGLARGIVVSCRRLMRCHPWHPGGFDPVPPDARPRRPAMTL